MIHAGILDGVKRIIFVRNGEFKKVTTLGSAAPT